MSDATVGLEASEDGSRDGLADIPPDLIDPNPDNPRRFFNEERLDVLRTSIQEVGILVPLIVYQDPRDASRYILMDGERRWRCAMDLGLPRVPTNVIPAPNPLENLLQMFNIHNVREEWPLISVALSLREVIRISHETGEKRLSEMTGLTRSTVRRAKRLLSISDSEIDLIRSEAHLDRNKQVHREDLYLEIEAAESVLRTELPSVTSAFTRDQIIRSFAQKAEVGSLNAITDFRFVGKLAKAIDDDIVDRSIVERAAIALITDPHLSPKDVFDSVASEGYKQQTLQKKVDVLSDEIADWLPDADSISIPLRAKLSNLRDVIDRVLGGSQ